MPNHSVTAAEINILNRIFWRKQSELLDRRIQDADLCQIAMGDLDAEAVMMVPLKNRRTFEQILAQTEKSRSIFQRAFSRKGGKSTKTDGLQGVILEIVRAEPEINTQRLLHRIRKMGKECHPVVFAVDRKFDLLEDQAEHIHFTDKGRGRTSPVSGLKDRLSRAKKEILSR